MIETANVAARLKLYGRFRFETEEGLDVTPKSAKAQALIALVATSDGGSRGRLWLQKRLWPNSPPDRASVSLRQCLSEIRRALGPSRDLLHADRRSVSLPLDEIAFAPPLHGEEFLEGIALHDGDHQLDEWLHAHREARATPVRVKSAGRQEATPEVLRPKPPLRPIVVFATRAEGATDLELIEEIFVDCVSRSLREMLTVDVYDRPQLAPPNPSFRVEVQAFKKGGAAVGIRARINRGPDSSLVWSNMTSTTLHGAPPVEDLEIVALGNQLIDALADAMTAEIDVPQDQRDANMLCRLAVRKIFCLRPEALLEADELLAQVQELGPRALGAAWRAQLRLIQEVELHPDRSDALAEEARLFCRDALELEPLNSMVLASVANTRLVLDRDVNACLELARRSVSLNPANPMAWNALANGKLYAGEIAEAHALAVRAQAMSSGSPFGFWWDFGRCLTAALTGRSEEAVRLAEGAHALSPEFRPPLRYLAALYAAAGRDEDAIRAGERLKRLEPDFSFDRMARDESYPISPLRRSGLLEKEKLITLGG